MRNSLEKNISMGILTIPNVAELMSVSHIVVRSMIERALADPTSYFPVLIADSNPNSKVREYRIPAGPFYDYCLKNRIPIRTQLAAAAKNYNDKYVAAASSPENQNQPIFATAEGTPVPFTPSAPRPADEMTPYTATQPALPFPLASPEVSTGKK